ncbi:MAG: PAS domain S-box protein [Clostridiales bacterium]|nr:PAS domain S-box protein [Clostridiales bacterium]
MQNCVWQRILKQVDFGWAYHKLADGMTGSTNDYLFLDVNPAFEKMTGLSREYIIGKKVTEIFENRKDEVFDWIGLYDRILHTGERIEFTNYSTLLKRWYKVTAFLVEEDRLISIFQDVTQEMDRIRALEENEVRLKELTGDLDTIFNATQDAMFLARIEDGEFRYIRNNAAHQRLAGYTVEDIKDKTPIQVLGKELGEIVKAGYQRAVDTKAPTTYEETLPFKAGTRTWLTTVTPVLKNGEVKYLVGSRKDITLQRKAEKEREELLSRLQSMFNEHSAIMLIIQPESGRIVDANPSACSFYGYTREELLSMNIRDLNGLSDDEVKEQCNMVLEGKKRYFIMPHTLKNGETRVVDVYSCPIVYNQGKLLFHIIFDVTDRERYKEELYREKELHRVTLLSIGDGVVTTDNEGRITMINHVAQILTGWGEEESKGKHFDEVFTLVSEKTGEKVENPINKVLKSGKVAGLANHTILITRDGRSIPIADSAAPIRDMDGQTFGVVMVFRDVIEERAWQTQILRFSYHDTLTGLYNRRYLEEQLEQMGASNITPIAVIIADVNGLKLTNDVFGHQEGDRLLKRAAEILKECCRQGDIIVRWGGDEYLVLLPYATEEVVQGIIENIKERCANEKGLKTQLSIAMGYAVKKNISDDIQKVIKDAEELMYRRKLMEGRSYRNAIINTLLSTLFAKSMETEEHAQRLKDYCFAIAQELNLSLKELDELSLLALLHDIGKVGIRESILQKPGPLTDAEWEEIKKHPEIGWRIAQNTPELASIAEYILCHHERWDGKGYPRGLKGMRIPLICRILAVADAYDAMTSDRSYRKAMSREEAIAEIRKNAGTQFDPYIVRIFLDIV